ncbi:MAG: hypothetical protein C4297_05205 [Gemmataceae bacterium]
MIRLHLTLAITLCGALCHPLPAWCQDKYLLKIVQQAPPMEINESIRALLDGHAYQILDGNGNVRCEIWFRKVVPVQATPEQVQNGLTYQEIPQTTLLGAVRYAQVGRDYRGQKIKPGVYTLRFALQPQDGDHMGTAPNPEFCLLVAADKDVGPELLDVKKLHELSASSMGGNHPGVLLLMCDSKPQAQPHLAEKQDEHWVLEIQLKADAHGKGAVLGIGLTVVGKSSAA